MKTLTIASFFVAALSSAVEAQAPSNFQQLMLNAVNAERAKNNLTALCTNSKLQQASQLHSEDQATNNFMSHTGSSGSTMRSRIDAQNFGWNSIAENVAAGQRDVNSVMQSWMSSSGHRANILGKYKFFGTGYSFSDSARYKHYWTQNFGTGSSESCDETGSDDDHTPEPTNPAPTSAPTTKVPTPGPTTRAPTAAPTSAPQPGTGGSLEKRMLDAVNAERAKMNLSPFCTNKKLQMAAQLHSDDQAKNNFMSHTGSNGSTMKMRIDAQQFKWNSIAENVAAGQADVAAVMKSWMSSSGHRANILGNSKFFGMGYTYSGSATYKHYWTQNFASGSTEACDV